MNWWCPYRIGWNLRRYCFWNSETWNVVDAVCFLCHFGTESIVIGGHRTGRLSRRVHSITLIYSSFIQSFKCSIIRHSFPDSFFIPQVNSFDSKLILINYDQASLIWGEKLHMVFFPIFSFRNSPYLAFFTPFSRFFHTYSSLLRVLWLVSEQF